MFSNIRIVLVNTSLPANIGSAARALKTMGLRQLVLVDPKVFPSSEATALASGASDVLANAKVVATLEDAIADCPLVIGASARSRTIPWPMLDAREAGELSRIESEKHPVALVFGREDRGLTNEELHQCHYHVPIPSDAEYGVLNVAAAVQVIAYEVRMAHLLAEKGQAPAERTMPLAHAPWDEELVPAKEMEQFFNHFEAALVESGFLDPNNPRQMPTRVRRMFSRLRLDRLEYNLWRGVFSRMQAMAAEITKLKKE
ncbi:MAG TPA: tRNA (cytosine(32)/uridine(32)-2'-O)-methyltransferase TrmJ [Agitococcus sp.]|nr:tRNA (cytosine(32)/uridine(32)-2'-O)-methyltransferase TrmJ [Agitococcus sp.]